MKKNLNYPLLLARMAVPILIYFYFLPWKTYIIYGDDLGVYTYLTGPRTLWDKLNMDLFWLKYRPVHDAITLLMVSLFKKDMDYYNLFNVAVQAINVFLMARLLNLFLRSPWFSLLFGLLVGISRFAIFNMTQITVGGALEGLSLTLLLLFLFSLMRAQGDDQLSVSQKQKGLLAAIVYANLAIYTHERYIVLFPFLILVVLLFPGFKVLAKKQRIGLILLALFSILLNVLIKTAVFSLPFFMGTSGKTMSFALAPAISFFTDAVLSIFQINTGPWHVVGMPFSGLPVFNQVLVLLLVAAILWVLVLYILKIRKAFAVRQKEQYPNFFILLFLSVLFILLLAPAVSTVRLEQRWLQGSFLIEIVILIIILNSLSYKKSSGKKWTLFLFLVFFYATDCYYMYKGGGNLYMVSAETRAKLWNEAIRSGKIRSGVSEVYLWEKPRSDNNEGGLNWVLGGDDWQWPFFEYYQGNQKKMIYVDSIYNKTYPASFCTFGNYDTSRQEILYEAYGHITDLSTYFEKDSLKKFTGKWIDDPYFGESAMIDKNRVLITADDSAKFRVQGFYEYDNGMRWTNGWAVLYFQGYFTIKDTLSVELNTYLPSFCKNVFPRISLTDDNNQKYQPLTSKRTGDKFTYTFDFNKFTVIQRIDILSDTVTPAIPGKKTLSFPFISMELKKINF